MVLVLSAIVLNLVPDYRLDLCQPGMKDFALSPGVFLPEALKLAVPPPLVAKEGGDVDQLLASALSAL
jgi:hypothetical protein